MAPRPASPPGTDPAFDVGSADPGLQALSPRRWIGWRLRLLMLAALLACLSVFLLMRLMASAPYIDSHWLAGPEQQLTLLSSPDPALHSLTGGALVAMQGEGGTRFDVDALLLQRSPRWQVDDARRARLVVMQEQLAAALASGRATLHFEDGRQVTVAASPRGFGGFGLLFWPAAALALLLMLMGAIVGLVQLRLRNALFFVMALCQAGNLLFIALESTPGLGLPAGVMRSEMVLRMALDGITAACAVHAFALYPRRLPAARLIAGATWATVAAVLGLALAGLLTSLWWWAQGLAMGLGLVALLVLGASHRVEPNPLAALLRRLSVIAVATLALVTAALATAAGRSGAGETLAVIGTVLWYLFFASLLLLAPYLSRSRQMLREFVVLAGISTVAASLDLLFVAVFSVSQFASLTLAVFLALGVYAGARQWMLTQLVGSSVLTTERTFEQLFAAARAVQAEPGRHGQLLTGVLRDLFEPLEVLPMDRGAPNARVVSGGSALLVPVRGSEDDATLPMALMLRFARRGKHLFTQEDARLAERVVEQLRRAVAYDKAVERGRTEERLRIAQDLHDDIGARLLTLMYQAQSSEMEDYIRHTLKDLKTLTRGLSSGDHRLSHAGAEWKADLTQRLTAAQVQLRWSFEIDHDVLLTMVQWSALTRVLRELVSNTLAHGQASRVDVQFSLSGQRLRLQVADDGIGRQPQGWAHGLGLGGVRKRVKLLGGEVHWREAVPRGIVCEVVVPDFGASR